MTSRSQRGNFLAPMLTNSARTLAASTLVFALASCSGATGTTNPDPAVLIFDASPVVMPQTDACATAGGSGSTWTALYRDYFGPSGAASCATNGGDCHGSATQTGAKQSGYVCGASQDECFKGMTVGSDPADFPPLVPAGGTPQDGGAQTPMQTALYTAMRLQVANATDPMCTALTCMPKLSCFEFTAADVARIEGWIIAGAQNN